MSLHVDHLPPPPQAITPRPRPITSPSYTQVISRASASPPTMAYYPSPTGPSLPAKVHSPHLGHYSPAATTHDGTRPLPPPPPGLLVAAAMREGGAEVVGLITWELSVVVTPPCHLVRRASVQSSAFVVSPKVYNSLSTALLA